VALGHYDGFANWAPYPFAPSTPEAARAVFADSADECLRVCTELELPAICATGVFDPDAVELSRLVDAFGVFCERAAALGIQVDLECSPMWGVPDLGAAWNIVGGAACSNSAILLDSWHFFRGNPDFELLRALPAGSIRTVQLADASLQLRGADLLEDCLRFRRAPGEGEFDLTRLLQILADKGGVTSVGAEVFSDELDAMPASAAAQRVAQATSTLLADAGFLGPDRAWPAGGACSDTDRQQTVLH
jgi:sugar phosphate isomerase/epimerase